MQGHHHHVWEYRWVQDLLVLGIVAAACWMAWAARGVTLPLLVGLSLAYAANPLIHWLQQRFRIPRWASASFLLSFLMLGLTGIMLYVVPNIYSQGAALIENMPTYMDRLLAPLGLEWEEVKGLAREAATKGDNKGNGVVVVTEFQGMSAGDLKDAGGTLFRWLGVGLGVVGTVINTTLYSIGALMIVAFTFVYFAWRFDELLFWFEQFIPHVHRERILRILHRMDKSVAGSLRGRMVQSGILSVLLCIGWFLVGVKYWLILGILGGAMNLVPYASMLGSPLVVALHFADKASSGEPYSLFWVIMAPTLVHGAGQFIDGWVIEPFVQGKATNLDGLTVLVVVLIGGTLFGVFGMLLAVPIAACIRILGEEWIVPKIKDYLRNVSSTT